ncbi:hypothetical protein AVEN_209837-1 [Araneus ventricosus]|uniref:Uncharacterized protein n=1 Tax=Araneus ventricosus TaxID=182803 RepID=A0A4Y2K9I8_ARAVE|nr:hypothetical protein AVEN_209837-1 [Araneus ventricosus]
MNLKVLNWDIKKDGTARKNKFLLVVVWFGTHAIKYSGNYDRTYALDCGHPDSVEPETATKLYIRSCTPETSCKKNLVINVVADIQPGQEGRPHLNAAPRPARPDQAAC